MTRIRPVQERDPHAVRKSHQKVRGWLDRVLKEKGDGWLLGRVQPDGQEAQSYAAPKELESRLAFTIFDPPLMEPSPPAPATGPATRRQWPKSSEGRNRRSSGRAVIWWGGGEQKIIAPPIPPTRLQPLPPPPSPGRGLELRRSGSGSQWGRRRPYLLARGSAFAGEAALEKGRNGEGEEVGESPASMGAEC
jgi:hypothetical protein